MKVLDIKHGTIVDGIGMRTSIYFSGCTHHCEGCHNPQSWRYQNGKDMTIEEILKEVIDEGMNVTFTGGDPIVQVHNLVDLARAVKAFGLNIWLYTGYTWEQLVSVKKCRELLQYIDVVVDGKFEKDKADRELHFRGSSNQRIIDVQESLKGEIKLWQPKF